MLFPTFEFLIFFTVVLILNWFLKKWPLFWRLFLIGASYYFYSVWDYRFLIILVLVSVLNYVISHAIFNNFFGRKKVFLILSIVINLSVLAIFKYYEFFRASFESVFFKAGFSVNFPLLNIILPVGLSFYILRVISFNADVYSGKIAELPSFLDVLLYIAFFPQLLAGPIMRAPDFLPQLKNGGAKQIEDLWGSFSLIILGFFKKLVISSYLALNITADVFAVPQNHSRWVVLLALLAYSIVIYFDFSAYSDMSIGFAGLLGFKSPMNFNQPYLAKNVEDFWRRWHISLSSWFRDYVYIPLGGNRKGFFREYLNLMVIMGLVGLWHGASFNYIIWGLLNGLRLLTAHIYEDYKNTHNIKPSFGWIKKIACWAVTFCFISFTWIFFASSTIGDAFSFIKVIFSPLKAVEPISLYVILVTIIGFLFFLLEKQIFQGFRFIMAKMPAYVSAAFMILFFILIFKLASDTVPSFIYFSF
jgi:D-alanyl-lipoteichoic acid acyltransferase DltB (MBOAT superfamily)